MKNKLFLLTGFLLVQSFGPMKAQSAYYYYGEKKISIYESGKSCLIMEKATNKNGLRDILSGSVKSERVIEDDKYDIFVVNAISSLAGLSEESMMVQPCYKNENGQDLLMTNYLNIELKNLADSILLYRISEKYHLSVVRQDRFLPHWYILSVTPQTQGTCLAVANEIHETGLFASSVPDFSSDDCQVSWDPLVWKQWALYNPNYEGIDLGVANAWDYATGSGIKIGVLDTGIESTHIDLSANLTDLGFDTESGTECPQVYNEHGTHCAGIAAAVRNNNILIAGVAPDAELVSISNRLSSSTNSRLKRADGIVWAYQHGIDVISNSWFSASYHAAIDQAIHQAFVYGREGKGCVVVFAAGNGYGDSVAYPANCNDTIIAVGAIDSTGTVASYSNIGEKLDVVAPGTDILSTVLNNGADWKSGTSMACPHVAGLAALILQRNPTLTVKEVNDLIESNTQKVGTSPYSFSKANGTWNTQYGYGLINAYRAIINTPRQLYTTDFSMKDVPENDKKPVEPVHTSDEVPDVSLGKCLDLKASETITDGNSACLIFKADVPSSGMYYLNLWLLPAMYADGTYTQLDVMLDGREIETLNPQKSGWQSMSINNGLPLRLSQGVHTITISTPLPEIPEIGLVRLATEKVSAEIPSSAYDAYLNKAIASKGKLLPDEIGSEGNSSIESVTLGGIQVFTNVPLKYSFYKPMSFVAGQQIIITTNSETRHVIDMFNTNDTDMSQTLNWTASSAPALNDTTIQMSTLMVTIPQSGFYLILVHSADNGVLGTVNVNINGDFYYANVPIYYSWRSALQPAGTPYATMTILPENSTADPIVFVEGVNYVPPYKLVAYNDDADDAARAAYQLAQKDAYLCRTYLMPARGLRVINYASYNPETTCTVLARVLETGNIASSEFRNMLYRRGYTTSIETARLADTHASTEDIYDLSGRHLKGEPKKGVYIKGGKKYIIK